MATTALPLKFPRTVAQKVSRLRLLVRLYSLAEGVAAIVIIAAIAFWLTLGIDWILEPLPRYRVVLWATLALAIGWAAWRYIVRRVFATLPGDSLALLVERHYRQLNEGLVTTVQASEFRSPRQGDEAHGVISGHGFNRTLLESTGEKAASALGQVRLWKVFNPQPLLRKVALATLLLASIILFAVMQQDVFAFWINRMQLDEQLWPRRVHLTVEGFEDRDPSRVINVARDDDFELNVFASLIDGHSAPDEVEIRWRRASDGMRGGGPMMKIGDAAAGDESSQRFQYSFKVSSDVEFDVIGGDDRLRNLRLRAVERPAVTRIWLEVEYPAYMGRQPRSLPISGRAELPEGAHAVCRVEANKPLQSVDVRDSSEQVDLAATVSTSDTRQFSFPIEGRGADQVLTIVMKDEDGVENRDPFRLPVSLVLDELPEVSVQLRGIGSAVTPQAMIPLSGKVQDDYGLNQVWVSYQIDEDAEERRPLRTQPEGLVEFPIAERFDLAEADAATRRPRVEVKVGGRLTLTMKASDAYDLGDQPHIGASQQMVLSIVSPSELRALLEKRELGLRQRFEAIYERMVSVQELLDRIDLAAAGGVAQDKVPDAGVPTETKPEDSVRVRERDRARMDGAQQTTTQLSFETSGVAEGFDDIVAELINNRVDTEELKERLEQGIAEPLKEVSGELLPQLETRIVDLSRTYDRGPATAGEALAAAKTDAAAAVDAMKAILDRMLELETYNEVVELLRGIVADQQQIKERTQQQQREKLRGLLED